MKAHWRRSPTTPVSALGPDTWMAQPQQLIVNGLALSFDLRVRSEELEIIGGKRVNKKKKEDKPKEILIDCSGEDKAPIIELE